MRKILFIGKMNETMKDLNLYLSKCFNVQLCAPNTDALKGVLSVMTPDIVLFSFIGIDDTSGDLFLLLKNDHRIIPVITIGTESEQRRLERFCLPPQYSHLTRPLEHSAVKEALFKRLNMSEAEIEAATLMGDSDGQKTILIVDDNPTTLRGIKGMLDDRYKVVMAPSGTKAITLIGKKRPDLILLDYEMPVVDGRQTLEMIRSDSEICDIPVIFLTGVSDREHIEAVMKLKPSGYLLKSSPKEAIIEAIEKAI